MNGAGTSPSKIEKAALFFLILGGTIWLGGMTLRGLVSSRLLVAGTLEFRQDLVPLVEREIFRIMNYASLVILITYLVVFFSGIVFLRTTHFQFKHNGWLVMSALLFYLFVPLEIYTSYLDGKMIYVELMGQPNASIFRELFIKRLGALKGLPIIALLCYYTIIGIATWQPLKKRTHPFSSEMPSIS